MDDGLALTLNGVEDAVEGGLHADHLALHDLDGGGGGDEVSREWRAEGGRRVANGIAA